MRTFFKMFKNCGLWALLVIGVTSGCGRDAKVQRHLAKAEGYLKSEDLEKARIEYLNVVQIELSNRVAIVELAKIYFAQGKFQEAFPLLNFARQLDPTNTAIQLKWALLLISSDSTNKLDKLQARAELQNILQREPTNEDALSMWADSANATNLTEIAAVRQRLQSLQQKTGDKALYHLVEASLRARQKDLDGAEHELRKAVAVEPKSSRAHLALGNFLFAKKQTAEAEKELKAAADLSPVKSAEHLRWAEFKLQTGATAEARQMLQEMTAKSPDFVPAWNLLGRLSLAEGKQEESEGFLKQGLAKNPNNADLLQLQAQLFLSRGETAKGIEVLEKLAQRYPGLETIHFQLANAYAATNNFSKAIASATRVLELNTNHLDAAILLARLRMANGDLAVATVQLTDLARKRPDVEVTYLLLAAVYQAQGRIDDALDLYRKMVPAFPTNPQPHHLTGMILLSRTNNLGALQSFTKAIEINPDYLPSILQLVRMDVREKRFVEARQRVDEMIRKLPKAAGPHLLMAQIWLAERDLSKAEAEIKKSLELEPDSRDAQMALAQFYVATKRQDEALANIEKLLVQKPRDPNALFMAGMLHEAAGRPEKARDSYEKLIAVNPRSPEVLNQLACVYADKLDQLDRGLELANKARALIPNNARATNLLAAILDTQGWILFRQGDYDRAAALLLESAQSLSDNAEVQYHLGMAQYMRGSEEAARVALGAAVRLEGDFKGKDDARRRLAFLEAGAARPDPKQVADLEKAVEQQPKDLIAILRLASAYSQTGKNDKAGELYEKALKLNPKAVIPMVRLAELYAGPLNQPAKALPLAKTARSLAPQDVRLGHLVGRLAFDAGDHAWAYNLLYESAGKQAGDADSLYDLAWAAYSLGRVDEAGQTMQRALQANPSLSRAASGKWLLTLLAFYTNSPAAAQSETQISQLLKAEPNNVPALMVSAVLAESRGRFTEARDLYEKCLQRYPLLAPAQRDLAALYADRLNEPAKAGDLATKARQTLTADAKLSRTQGKAALQKGDANTAVRYLQEATRLAPGDALAFYYLGQAHAQLKQKKEAAAALQQAVILDPKAPFVTDAQKLLKETR